MRSRIRPASDRGFTLVEVMAAILILLVGVLGAVSLVDGANAVTSKTKAREAGTSIARSIIEVSRSIRYRDLTADQLLAALDSRDGLGDARPSQTGYTIVSRNVDYEVTLTVCSLDDDKDNLGPHTGPVAYCSDTDTKDPLDTRTDRNPDDYKRVRVTLNWSTRGVGHSITQTSAIINPVGGLGPSVTSLTPINVADNDPIVVNSPTLSSINFHVTTSSSAQGVRWALGGNPQGTATGSGKNWNFTWNLDTPSGDTIYHDCTYVVQADAFDAQDRSGTSRSRTVILNRHAPQAPANFGGGRNGSADFVDLQWFQNAECDIRGYRVYRSNTAGVRGTAFTCLNATTDITEDQDCIDNPPGSGTWYYTVVALDLPPGSTTPREGTNSTQITVGAASAKPDAPENVALCVGDGTTACLDAAGNAAPFGMVVVSWDPVTDPDGVPFYRIYRDGTGYVDRYDEFFPDPSQPGYAWPESDSSGTSHTYYVTAVDGTFAESALSDPISGG